MVYGGCRMFGCQGQEWKRQVMLVLSLRANKNRVWGKLAEIVALRHSLPEGTSCSLNFQYAANLYVFIISVILLYTVNI